MVKLRDLVESLKDQACRERLLEYYSDKLELEISTQAPDEKLLRILKALANPRRLRILTLVAQVEMPVCLITHILGEDQSLISHHLSVLKEAGLVRVRAQGRFRFYEANEEVIEKLLHFFSRHRRRRE